MKWLNWKNIQKAAQFCIRNRTIIAVFLVILGIYWINTFHTNFPDEFDNIVGGWYINRGILPYIGFFSHHNPGAYYIASIITLFSKQSFVLFREIWALVLFVSVTGSYLILRKKLGEKDTYFYIFYIALLAVSATYFWGHMLLSETVVGYMLVPSWILVLIKHLKGKPLSLQDIWFISITSAVALLTSFTFVFMYGLFLLFVMYLLVRESGFFSKKVFFAAGIIALPYIGFLLYLLLTGSLAEFYFQSIVYNRDYYIYNFPMVSGQISTHPIRYAISIFYNTTLQFHALLFQVKDFNFAYPVNITLLLINLSLIAYLLSRKKYTLSILVYFMMIYLNARGEPISSKETDFHSTVYIMFSLVNFTFVMSWLVKEFDKELGYIKKLLYTSIVVLISIYGAFTILLLSKSFLEKTYTKFMGQAPAIYDEAVAAPFINKIVSSDEYFWIGPFEFQELLYINGKLPSKYHWFLPANARSDRIKTEINKDLLKNRPKLIVFKEYISAFGVTPGEFNYPIVNILKENYFRLSEIDPEFETYSVVNKNLHNFDIWTDFYFDKTRKEEILSLLVEKGIVELKK